MNERDADAGSKPSYFAARAAKAARRLAAILLNAKFKHFVHDFLRLHHRCLLIIENEKSCSLSLPGGSPHLLCVNARLSSDNNNNKKINK